MATPEDRNKQLARHVAPYIDKLYCPVCGTRDWNALGRLIIPAMTESFLVPSNTGVPLGMLVCRKCGFAHFFVWKTVEEGGNG